MTFFNQANQPKVPLISTVHPRVANSDRRYSLGYFFPQYYVILKIPGGPMKISKTVFSSCLEIDADY